MELDQSLTPHDYVEGHVLVLAHIVGLVRGQCLSKIYTKGEFSLEISTSLANSLGL